MANTIITKNSSTASAVPTSGDLVKGELAVNVTDKRLFTEDNGGTVVELGTNPSTMAVAGNATVGGTLGVTGLATLASSTLTANPTLSAGTANGVLYLNGSKVATSGSALTFDGTNLGIGGLTNPGSYSRYIEVAGTDAAVFVRDTDIAGAWGALTQSGSASYLINNQGDWRFWANGSEQMRLTSTGLGIGTSSPISGSGLTVADATYPAITIASLQNNSSWTQNQEYGKLAFYSSDSTGLGAGETAKISVIADTSSTTYPAGALAFFTSNRGVSTTITERMRLDSAGNLGLGVTPNAGTSGRVLQTNNAGHFMASGPAVYIDANAYYDSGWKYITTAAASNYYQSSGAHIWNTAASGTAGNAITFTQAMTLNASGNLGLGVTPSAWSSEFRTMQIGLGGAVYGRTVAGDGDKVGMSANVYKNTSFVDTYITTDSASRYDQSGGAHYWYYAASGTAGTAITFTQAMTLNASGNLGLGVSPSAWFSGNKALEMGTRTSLWTGGIGQPNLGYNCYVNTSANFVYKATAAANYYAQDGEHKWYNAASGTAGTAITFTQAMTLDASGRLGIGVTSPTQSLDVNGNVIFRIASATTSRTLGFTTPNGVDGWTIGNGVIASANQFVIYSNTAGAARMLIDSSGNLLVGTTSQINTTKTSIKGTSGTNVLGLQNSNDNNYLITALNSSGTEVFRVAGTGNVVNTNNSYGALSDGKLKENIVDASPKLADLMQVKVRNYNLIGDTAKQLGVIAQELETVFPAMVEEAPDRDAEGNDLGTTTKSVKYSVFVPMLIKAMQEQQAIINDLKARLDAANL